MKILVTGASGFVGRVLCRHLLERGHAVAAALRSETDSLPKGVERVAVSSLGPETPWQEALYSVETVIHLAARVHVMRDVAADPLAEFRRVNVDGTVRLAEEAVAAGVRRLVYVSSIKVNGEESSTPYRADSVPHPCDPYGISKWEAEQALQGVAERTGLELVVLRPPLVYGPEVRGNFLQMMRALRRGMPLPFASVRNRRSLIYVGNLADALATCAVHPDAAGRTFLLCDGEDLSTAELLKRTAGALGVPARLLPVPTPLLALGGALAGKRGMVSRLCGSLTVDGSEIRRVLGWTPPYSVTEGVRETAEWFRSRKGE